MSNEIKEVSNSQLGAKVDQLEKEIGKLEKKMNTHGRAISRLDRKVFNGFGQKIDAFNGRMEVMEKSNEAAHTEIKKVMGGFIKFAATSLILIFLALVSILGSIWLRDRQQSQPVQMEVRIDAPGDQNIVIE